MGRLVIGVLIAAIIAALVFPISIQAGYPHADRPGRTQADYAAQ